MTRRFPEAILRRYVHGTLSPWRTALVEAAAEADPELRAALAALAEPSEPADQLPGGWLFPPPGVSIGPTVSFAVDRPVHLGESRPLRPWERFLVHVGPVLDADQRRIVVLLRRPGGWSVLSPTDPAEDLRLSDLPRRADGRTALRLPAQPIAGQQRWAVALPPREPGPDWSLPPEERWRPLQEAMEADLVPVFTFEIEVEPG